MPGLLHAIVQNWVSGSLQCRNIVSSDGITTRNFTINRLPGICVGTSIDAELSRRNINSLGNALGIAKNLDEYQLKICLKIPSLPDSDPAKIHLQKFRIGIIASFAILVATLHSDEPENRLVRWNIFAAKLLRKTSEFFNSLRTDIKPDDGDLEETFKFFQVPIADVYAVVKGLYSY
jgi:hypothetical protein